MWRERWSGGGPPRSPELTPCDFLSVGKLKIRSIAKISRIEIDENADESDSLF